MCTPVWADPTKNIKERLYSLLMHYIISCGVAINIGFIFFLIYYFFN